MTKTAEILRARFGESPESRSELARDRERGALFSVYPRRPWAPIFFAIAACSWVPHWSCHYYRLETGSSFIVGSWHVSRAASALFLFLYTGLCAVNLVALTRTAWQSAAAFWTGTGHLFFAFLHLLRLSMPFSFVVFGYPWSRAASLRETLISLSFSVICFAVAWHLRPLSKMVRAPSAV